MYVFFWPNHQQLYAWPRKEVDSPPLQTLSSHNFVAICINHFQSIYKQPKDKLYQVQNKYLGMLQRIMSMFSSQPTQRPVSSPPPVKQVPQPPPPPPPPKPPVSLPSGMMTIQVRIVNSLVKTTTVSKNMTGKELKQHIYDKVSQELQPSNMAIYYQGAKITNNMKLGEVNIVVGDQLKVIQQKADIADVVSNVADANGIDPLTDEVGTAKMACGHHIGKDSMTALIKSLISSNKYEIRCPNSNEDDQPCQALWDFSICRKIGVLTMTEVQTFENGLSENWLKENAKTCPKCKCSISKYMLTNNRVVCPKCKYGDFCFLCLNTWKGSAKDFCGNEQCKFLNDFVSQAPWTRKFNLIDPNDGNKSKEYNTPLYRACVHCYTIIEHKIGCKHMTCRSCKKEFCWICLGVKVNGSYPCGSYNHYCGKTAQAQKFGGK